MQIYRDKLPEHVKLANLMNNWDILGTSFELIDLVGCVIPDGINDNDIYIGLDSIKCLAGQYENTAMFHKEKRVLPQVNRSLNFGK